MPVCHVLYTPTNHDLAQVQISLDNNVERSFSVLIHKSVGNDMGQLICGAIWICCLSHFINQFTFIHFYFSIIDNYAALSLMLIKPAFI